MLDTLQIALFGNRYERDARGKTKSLCEAEGIDGAKDESVCNSARA
jgi:hypothetical protein